MPVFTSLYQGMKKLSHALSCIKPNVYVFLFYFFRLYCSCSSRTLRHPSLGLSSSLLTSGKELNPSSQEDARFSSVTPRRTIFTSSCVIPPWGSAQLTPPSVKSSTLPLRKIPVFQGVAPWHTNFTLPCVIPLWDSATAQSPSEKSSNFPLWKNHISLGFLFC